MTKYESKSSDIVQKIAVCLPIVILILASATVGIVTSLTSHTQPIKTNLSLSNSSIANSPQCLPNQLRQVVAGFRSGVNVGGLTNSAVGVIIHWQNISSQACHLHGYPKAQFLSDNTVVSVDEMNGLFWLPFISPINLPTIELKPHGGIASAAIFYLHYPHPIAEQGDVPWYNSTCPKINTINIGVYNPLSSIPYSYIYTPIQVRGLNSKNLGNNFTPCPRVVDVSNFQSGVNADNDWPPPKFPAPAATTTTTDPSTITNIAPAGTPYCNPNQLKFGWSHVGGGTTTFWIFLMIQNESTRISCSLQGIPSFIFEDANGTPLPSQDQPQWDHNVAPWTETAAPPDILMLPKGKDYAMIGWIEAQNANRAVSACTNAPLMTITLPTGGSTIISDTFQVGQCLAAPPEYGQFTQIPINSPYFQS